MDSPIRANQAHDLESAEQSVHSERDISDVPLKVTDKRYRLECDRLREDEAWQIKARRSTSSVAVRAAEEPKVREVNNSRSRAGNAHLDLGSVSNHLTQEQRQRAANELFASLGYATYSPRRTAGAPWKLVLVLVMALAGMAGYGYLAMRQNGIPVWRLPGVQTAIVLNQRLDAAGSRARADVQTARQRSHQLITAARERWARWRR